MLCRTRWTSSHNALKEHFPFSFSVSTENWCQIENTLLHSLIKKMEEGTLEIFFDLIILGQLISKQILCYWELKKYIDQCLHLLYKVMVSCDQSSEQKCSYIVCFFKLSLLSDCAGVLMIKHQVNAINRWLEDIGKLLL